MKTHYLVIERGFRYIKRFEVVDEVPPCSFSVPIEEVEEACKAFGVEFFADIDAE